MNNQQFSAFFTFECAARHLSFAKTAEELCLTPSAVSHRIKNLEQQLGFTLFHRISRQLSLTEDGQRLFLLLSRMLSELRQEVTDIQRNELSGHVTILVRPSIAQCWLIPRLVDFRRRYPTIQLDIRTGNDNVDFVSQSVDVVIYYTEGGFPGLDSVKLMDEVMLPVCSMQYAQANNLMHNLENLEHCTLLHDANAWPRAAYDIEWRLWLKHFYPQMPAYRSSMTFDSSELSIIAAMNHAGVAIGRYRTVQRRLEQKELVAPFGDQLLPSPCSYYMVFPRSPLAAPRQKVFIEWLQEIAQESMNSTV